ncbi:MAG: phosphate signaling complex protein PhoU [Thermoplasmatota archaeon]
MVRNRFQEQLAALDQLVRDMGDQARTMLHDGIGALADLDRARAQTVIDQTEALANLDEEVETTALEVLTLQSPVARDLRHVGAVLKLATYLNRVGRYGYDIASVCAKWPDETHVARPAALLVMGEKVERMLDLVMQSFADAAAPDLETIAKLEDDVDALRYSIWRETLTYMAEDPHNIERGAHYMMVARYLERSGDNICKMAEKLHYAATAQRVWLR